MMGHVATSIGGALPGSDANPLIGQKFYTATGPSSTTVPAGAAYVFAEAVGAGGYTNGQRGSGGAGSDAIVAVIPGSTISFVAPTSKSSFAGGLAAATISVGGTTVTAASAPQPAGATGTVVAGKYPGQAPTVAALGGIATSRLGGAVTTPAENDERSLGIGVGAYLVSGYQQQRPGGPGAVCLTFFTTYDAALAFANSLYNGAWAP